MSIEIKVPVLPESVADATIAAWHVQLGEQVSRDQNLVDIETDKVVLEVVAPEDGKLTEFFAQEGDTVLAEQVIACFVAENVAGQEVTKPVVETVSPHSSNGSESVNLQTESTIETNEVLSPSVRRVVAEHEVDSSLIKGTGVGSRITKDDVGNFIKQQNNDVLKPKTTPAPEAPQSFDATPNGRNEKRVPMTRLRKTIANRLLESKNSTAMLTTFNEVSMKPIMDIRKTYQDIFVKKHGVKLGFMSFYVKAVTEALKRFPEVNASLDGNDLVYHNYFDISIAVSTPRGLVTPVLRDTDTMGLADIEKAVKELAIKGRDGKLTVDDMTGGNFTITNGGVFGSLMSTPILNLPQSAILGMHAIKDRPMAVDGQVVILPMMYLALSYDHRIIDGRESVGFLVTIKDFLEDPTRMLLDL